MTNPTDAGNRSTKLCTYSKDGNFCGNPKVVLRGKGQSTLNLAYCEGHQGLRRYILLAFKTQKDAQEFSVYQRYRRSMNANLWQKKYVIVGPTSNPSVQLMSDKATATFESQMYEDTLMLAIKALNIDLTHIVGQKGEKP